jgi:myo-inositol-1(or 4)-monophosphatase
MHPMVNIAVRAARNAGNIMVRHLDRLDSLTVESKGRNDFVSEVDRMAKQEIIGTLRKAYPDHAVLGEETGSHGTHEYEWIIDPLDGTTNYLHGLPHFAVSIALRHRGRLEAGVIYDPLRQELYTAHRGGGAQLDGRRIRVSARKELTGSLIGTGFPFRAQRHFPAYLEMFRALTEHASDLRRAGAAALDLAYVAAGRLDGFWEIGLQPWDMAAGVLLVREAGGIVSDFRGGEAFMQNGNVVCGNPKVFKGLLTAINPHCTPELLK